MLYKMNISKTCTFLLPKLHELCLLSYLKESAKTVSHFFPRKIFVKKPPLFLVVPRSFFNTSLIHGCFRNSTADGRCVASLTSNCRIKSFASSDMPSQSCDGNVNSPFLIALYVSLSFSLRKGDLALNSAYARIPMDHRSHE